MKCKKCNHTMVERKGKFGVFLACPKSNPTDNHGTITIPTGQKAYVARYYGETDLDKIIQIQMAPFIGRMTDMDLFLEGDIKYAEDDEDHWSNIPLY